MTHDDAGPRHDEPRGTAQRPATGQEILARLLALTPDPPPAADAEALLAAFEQILAARAVIVATLVPPIALDRDARALLLELERRQVAWHDALAAAQRAIGEQRLGADRMRAYGGAR